jgi:hypothetical protein
MNDEPKSDGFSLTRCLQFALTALLGFLAGLAVGATEGDSAASPGGREVKTAQVAQVSPEETTSEASPSAEAAAPSDEPPPEPSGPLAPAAAAPPLGSELHEYLRQRGFLVHKADRRNGVVEWNHTQQPLKVLARFAPGESPIFERTLVRLVLEQDDKVAWISQRVALDDGALLVDAGEGWQPRLAELPVTRPPLDTKAPRLAESYAPEAGQEIINGWRVDVAPLDESTRRKIYYELCRAQDLGVGDTEAYTLLAKRYGLDEKILYQIAGEGAVKQWPLPPVPSP